MDKTRRHILIECTKCFRKGGFSGSADITWHNDDDEINARKNASDKAEAQGWELDPCLCNRCSAAKKFALKESATQETKPNVSKFWWE